MRQLDGRDVGAGEDELRHGGGGFAEAVPPNAARIVEEKGASIAGRHVDGTTETVGEGFVAGRAGALE